MIPAFLRLIDAHTLAPGPVKVISRVARGLTRCRLAWERNHLPFTSEPVAAVDTANGSAQRLYSSRGGWKCCAMLIRVRKKVHATCYLSSSRNTGISNPRLRRNRPCGKPWENSPTFAENSIFHWPALPKIRFHHLLKGVSFEFTRSEHQAAQGFQNSWVVTQQCRKSVGTKPVINPVYPGSTNRCPGDQ